MLPGRARLPLGGALALALLAIGAPGAGGACGGVKHVRASRDLTPGAPPLAIGDSVLLGALDEVARAGFEIDTRGCRQMGEGLRLLRARRRAGRLPSFVVIALGTKLNISPGEIRAALRIVGRRRVLGLVTPREEGGGSGSDARVVRQAGRHHPRRVIVLDWVAYSAGRGGWFGDDGIHLGPGGAAGLARLLGRGLRHVYPLVARFEFVGARAF
jgi:hypothetical protein